MRCSSLLDLKSDSSFRIQVQEFDRPKRSVITISYWLTESLSFIINRSDFLFIYLFIKIIFNSLALLGRKK